MDAPSAGPPTITPVVRCASSARDRVITTYRADAWEAELREWGLWEKYSALPNRLRHGFPIGDMTPLTETFTPENHKGAEEHMDFVENYVSEQVAQGHMTGPYAKEEVEALLGTPFRSSPLSVVEKAGSTGKWRLIQNCSFADRHGVSVNDMIDSDEFPTEWGTATEVAEIVSPSPSFAQQRARSVGGTERASRSSPRASLVPRAQDCQRSGARTVAQ